MLIKLSSKNQVTVPRRLLAKLPSTKYFEVELENGALVMKPGGLVETELEQIQRKMTDLGLRRRLRGGGNSVGEVENSQNFTRHKRSRLCPAVWRPTRPS